MSYLDNFQATDENMYINLIINLYENNSMPKYLKDNCKEKQKCYKLIKNSEKFIYTPSTSYKNLAIAELLYKKGYENLAIEKIKKTKNKFHIILM